MDLPRGTFRSLQKGVHLRDILDEIVKKRFSGILTFSSGNTMNGTLVFKSGICTLANIQDQYGAAAWDGAQALPDQVFDIVLSDLDNTQLQLALDFNKKAHVQKGGSRQETASEKAKGTDHVQEQKQHGAPARHRTGGQDFTQTTHVTFGQSGPDAPAEQKTPVPHQAEKKEPFPEGQSAPAPNGKSSAEKDFDTFDSMDLDDVAQKIRKEAKIIVKQLQLDHLTEK